MRTAPPNSIRINDRNRFDFANFVLFKMSDESEHSDRNLQSGVGQQIRTSLRTVSTSWPRAKYFPIRPYHPVSKNTILWCTCFVLLVRDKLRFFLDLPMLSWDIESTTTTFSVLNSLSSRRGTKNLAPLAGVCFLGDYCLARSLSNLSTSITTCLANEHALKYHIDSCVWATRKYCPWRIKHPLRILSQILSRDFQANYKALETTNRN